MALKRRSGISFLNRHLTLAFIEFLSSTPSVDFISNHIDCVKAILDHYNGFVFYRRILASTGYSWFNYRDLGPKRQAAFTAHIKQLD
jgi:hypothetical protein